MRALTWLAYALIVRGGKRADGATRNLITFLEMSATTPKNTVPMSAYVKGVYFAVFRLGLATARSLRRLLRHPPKHVTRTRRNDIDRDVLGARACITRYSNAFVSPINHQRFVWENFTVIVGGGAVLPWVVRSTFHMFASISILRRVVLAHRGEGRTAKIMMRKGFFPQSIRIVIGAMIMGINSALPATGIAGPTNCCAATEANTLTNDGHAKLVGNRFAVQLDVHGHSLIVLKQLVIFSAKSGIIAHHVHTLIPLLLVLSQVHPRTDARQAAVYCLGALFDAVPYTHLHQYKNTIAAALRRVLDDPRRSVRKEAVRCKNVWALVRWERHYID